MSKIELTIVAITTSDTKENGFIVVLKEKEGERHLPILVGGFEARAIAMEIERIFTPRPMSHDLMKRIIIEMKGDLSEVLISDLKDEVYFASLVIKMEDGSNVFVDARSSDAIALAVRFGCGIFVATEVLEKAGVAWEGFVQKPIETTKVESLGRPQNLTFTSMTIEELQAEMGKALVAEDYEKAALIRDELEKRK